MCILGKDKFADVEPVDFKEFQGPYEGTDVWKIIKSICFVLVAFSFQINLFPIYSALKVKTNENCRTTITISLTLVGLLYGVLSVSCIFLFGGEIDIMKGNIMENVNSEYQLDPSRWESFVLRVLFMIVLACHIPFIFFSGKEGLLIMIDECRRRSISQTLEKRVAELNLEN